MKTSRLFKQKAQLLGWINTVLWSEPPSCQSTKDTCRCMLFIYATEKPTTIRSHMIRFSTTLEHCKHHVYIPRTSYVVHMAFLGNQENLCTHTTFLFLFFFFFFFWISQILLICFIINFHENMQNSLAFHRTGSVSCHREEWGRGPRRGPWSATTYRNWNMHLQSYHPCRIDNSKRLHSGIEKNLYGIPFNQDTTYYMYLDGQ